MLLMITTFVITATLAWVAVSRANENAKLGNGMSKTSPRIKGFAAL